MIIICVFKRTDYKLSLNLENKGTHNKPHLAQRANTKTNIVNSVTQQLQLVK